MKKLLLAVALSFCIVTSAIAEKKPFFFPFNSGGLNTKASHFALQSGESPDCRNVYFQLDGSVQKRKGYVTVDANAVSAGEFDGIYHFTQNDGSEFLLVAVNGTIQQSSSLTSPVWTDITSTETVTATNKFTFETFQDTAIFTNGTDLPFKWTGSGNIAQLDVPTGLTKAKWVLQFRNYLILGNVTVSGTVHPSRFYWSALKDITSWTATDFIDVSDDDGEAIEGMYVLGDRLIVFKESSVFSVIYTGDVDIPFIVVSVPSSIGTVSGYSIQDIGGALVYLYWDGLYLFDGSYSRKISLKIDPTIDGYTKNSFSSAPSLTYDTLNQYWCGFDTNADGTYDRIIVYDYFLDAFTEYSGITPTVFGVVHVSGDERPYFGDSSGYIYRLDQGYNDNGSAIDAYYWTKWFEFEDPIRNKKIDHIYLYLEDVGNYDLDVGYNFNHQLGTWKTYTVNMTQATALVGTAVVGTAEVGGSGGIISRIDATGQGRVWRLKISNSTVDEEFNMRGFGCIVDYRSYL